MFSVPTRRLGRLRLSRVQFRMIFWITPKVSESSYTSRSSGSARHDRLPSLESQTLVPESRRSYKIKSFYRERNHRKALENDQNAAKTQNGLKPKRLFEFVKTVEMQQGRETW